MKQILAIYKAETLVRACLKNTDDIAQTTVNLEGIPVKNYSVKESCLYTRTQLTHLAS